MCVLHIHRVDADPQGYTGLFIISALCKTRIFETNTQRYTRQCYFFFLAKKQQKTADIWHFDQCFSSHSLRGVELAYCYWQHKGAEMANIFKYINRRFLVVKG